MKAIGWLALGAGAMMLAARKRGAAEPIAPGETMPASIPSAQPKPPDGYRRAKASEVGPEAIRQAKASLSRPWGSWVPFEEGGRQKGILLEWHYHEPGGSVKPWGWHKGASVFVREEGIA